MDENNPLWGWERYFDELSAFIASLDEDSMTFANENYTDYVVVRLSTCITTLSRLLDHLQSSVDSVELNEEEVQVIDHYQTQLSQLLGIIRDISSQWRTHFDLLQRRLGCRRETAFQLSTSTGLGRPKFNITKDQLEYLSSLSFSWSQIGQLLGVSRMTIYRRRVEFGLLVEPTEPISNTDLLSTVHSMRSEFPEMGECMVWGQLRSMGIQVTRQRVRNALREIDPLNTALRWRGGLAKRRAYSVPGPNSLWHLGETIIIHDCMSVCMHVLL